MDLIVKVGYKMFTARLTIAVLKLLFLSTHLSLHHLFLSLPPSLPPSLSHTLSVDAAEAEEGSDGEAVPETAGLPV